MTWTNSGPTATQYHVYPPDVGQFEFEEIEGTNLLCAINSNVTVLNEGDVYYAIDSAVWFVSGNEHGPWAVCINRPEEVDQIPPTSPVYNVKYVYIYESTPDVVYVGYTAGYYHSYMYYYDKKNLD